MDGSDFQQNKPERCKIGIKNEEKTFYFGNHIRTFFYLVAHLSSYHKKAINALYELA